MFTTQIEQALQAQRQQLEPVLRWNAFAVQVFEKVARKNYEVAGDCLEFVVGQSQVPAKDKPFQDIVSDVVNGNRVFSEKMTQRGAEYVELTKEISALAPGAEKAA